MKSEFSSPGKRLKSAREKHFGSARGAANEFGWPLSSYGAHENGSRIFKLEDAAKYARAFGVKAAWLLLGNGEKEALNDDMDRGDGDLLHNLGTPEEIIRAMDYADELIDNRTDANISMHVYIEVVKRLLYRIRSAGNCSP